MRFVLSIPFFLDPVFLNSQCLLSNTHCACLSYRQLGCDNFSAGFSWLVVAQLWHASVQKKSDSSAVRSSEVEPQRQCRTQRASWSMWRPRDLQLRWNSTSCSWCRWAVPSRCPVWTAHPSCRNATVRRGVCPSGAIANGRPRNREQPWCGGISACIPMLGVPASEWSGSLTTPRGPFNRALWWL